MLDIKKVQEDAKQELMKERFDAAKDLVKDKLEEIVNAQRVVTNLERELEDLYADLGSK